MTVTITTDTHLVGGKKKRKKKSVSGYAGSYPETVPGSGMCSVLIVKAVRVAVRVRAVSLSSQQMRPDGDSEERGGEVTDRTCDPVVATPAVSPPLPPNHCYLCRPHPANWPMLPSVHTHTCPHTHKCFIWNLLNNCKKASSWSERMFAGALSRSCVMMGMVLYTSIKNNRTSSHFLTLQPQTSLISCNWRNLASRNCKHWPLKCKNVLPGQLFTNTTFMQEWQLLFKEKNMFSPYNSCSNNIEKGVLVLHLKKKNTKKTCEVEK